MKSFGSVKPFVRVPSHSLITGRYAKSSRYRMKQSVFPTAISRFAARSFFIPVSLVFHPPFEGLYLLPSNETSNLVVSAPVCEVRGLGRNGRDLGGNVSGQTNSSAHTCSFSSVSD